jgi:Flp pilus assembly secretin CpaC
MSTASSAVTVLAVAVVCFFGNWKSQADAADSPGPSAEEPQIVLKATIIDIDSESMAKLGITLSDLMPDSMPDDSRTMPVTEKTKTPIQVTSLTVGEGELLVKLLRGIGAAKILAEPTVVSTIGRKASFHSGGHFLVSVPQANGGTIVETRKVGTFLDFTATKQSSGQLRIEIRVGHSERDDSRTVTLNGVTVPGLRSRWLDTAFMARSGQTVMFVSDQGLVFMVTPEVVDPQVSTPLSVVHLPSSVPASANRELIIVDAILYRADIKALYEKGIDLGKGLPSTTASTYTTNTVSSVIGARQLSALVRRLADSDDVEVISRPQLHIPSNTLVRAEVIGRIRVPAAQGTQPASAEHRDVGVSIVLAPVALENGQVRLTASANVSRVTGHEKAIEAQGLHGKGDLYAGESLVVYEQGIDTLLIVTPRRMSSHPASDRSPPQIVDEKPKRQNVRPSAKPTLNDEIRELHNDVKVLRREVGRLIDILEKRDSTSLKTAPPDDDHSSNTSEEANFKEVWDVTLDEVISIGLQNSKAIRDLGGVTPFGFDGEKEVVLSRVNKEVSLAKFEAAVRNLLSDAEGAYWELWAAHRNLDTAKRSRDAAQTLWKEIYERVKGGMVHPQAELQAREQYFFFRDQFESALKELYSREGKLRLVIGLASSDGGLMRAADEATTEKYIVDWNDAKKAALSNSVELRQQRRVVEQAELELATTKTSLQPQLDLLQAYRWYGAGGIDFLSPVESRRAAAGMRSATLKVAREKARLEDMELNITHLLTKATRDIDFFYQSMKTHSNRSLAAESELESTAPLYKSGKTTLDIVLDAQRRLTRSKIGHTSALAQYMTAIKDARFLTGSLLAKHNVLIEMSEELLD